MKHDRVWKALGTTAVVFVLLLAGCGGPMRSAVGGGQDRRAARSALEAARSQIGAPYRFGGASPETGFDCSGLVYWSYRRQDVELPRSTRRQILAGRPVELSGLEQGDLVFFQITTAGALHVGIYSGADRFVHSPKSGGRVREESLRKPYWLTRYRTARRVD